MNLLISLRSEILKTKRTALWYLIGLAALIVPLTFLIDICTDGMEKENMIDPSNAFFMEGSKGLGVVIFPFFIILICTLLPQVEYRNNTWKQVFASPQTMAQTYFAKFLNLQLLIILFMITYNLMMLLGLGGVHSVVPSVMLNKPGVDWTMVLTLNINLYLSILAISAFQFWMGLRFKNFIAPVAIGVMLWVTACFTLMEMHLKGADLFPFSFSIMSVFEKFEDKLPTLQVASVAYAALFLMLGFIDFRRRRLRG